MTRRAFGVTVTGLVGMALVWLAERLPGHAWLATAIGALMVAVAPSVLYPLSALLLVGAIALVAVGLTRRERVPASA